MNDPLVRKREEALKIVGHLLEERDEDLRLLISAKELLKTQTKFINRISEEIENPDIDTSLVIRCVAKKTQESLSSIVALVEDDRAYYGIPLLRPMCEELIFVRFIKTLPTNEANEFLREKSHLELLEGLKAQGEFFTKQQELFLRNRPPEPKKHPAETKHLAPLIKEQKRKLKDLGRTLGWVQRAKDRPLPTVRYMAKITDSLDAYEFFYHAASSAVHANLHNLFRMVWGNRETNLHSITNRNFDTYYRKFALVYGAWVATEVVFEIINQFPDKWPKEEDDAYNIWLAFLIEPAVRHCFPPIVTERELR